MQPVLQPNTLSFRMTLLNIFLFSIIRVGITLIPIGCGLLLKLEIFQKFRNFFFFILFEK